MATDPQVSTYFEASGILQQHSSAELLSEIISAGLSGSVRAENGQQKVILYFIEGKMVFAVSNARQHRLFDFMLRSGQVTKETITQCRDFTNDQALAAFLIGKHILDKQGLPFVVGAQLREIVEHFLSWKEGNWTFNGLARIKEDVWQEADLTPVLTGHSKNIPAEELAVKFGSGKDVFTVKGKMSADQVLSSAEYFVLSRLDQPSTIREVCVLTGFSEEESARILYTLWIGGFITRGNYTPAFSREKIEQILTAEIKLVEKTKPTAIPAAPAAADQPDEPAAVEKDSGETTTEKYLEQVEKAETYYDVLGVFQNTDISEIKAKYFALAKNFHPDRFHSEAGSELHKRIQSAFTQISQSYETLKDPEAREVYNFKVRRQLEKLQKRKELLEEMKSQGKDTALSSEEELQRLEQASEEFDYGFDHLMNEDHSAAIPFFARAIKLAPEQARYHAYYGKALSSNGKNRHQAEQELVAAIKIEPGNTSYRLMLVEFYIEMNLLKRAEGELKKILAKEPRNEDALNLLDSIQK